MEIANLSIDFKSLNNLKRLKTNMSILQNVNYSPLLEYVCITDGINENCLRNLL